MLPNLNILDLQIVLYFFFTFQSTIAKLQATISLPEAQVLHRQTGCHTIIYPEFHGEDLH